jgi:glycosyltransferase involved in cell wall biosynthesis
VGGRRFDVVFVQKAIMTAYVRGMLRLLRACARRIVYDLDDAVHLSPPHPLRNPWRLLEDREQSRKLFLFSKLVLAGNPWLASVAEAAGARVALFPTVVDTERFVPTRREPETYRIGWIGGPSTTGCLVPAAGALEGTCHAELRFVGADPLHVPCQTAEVRPWSYGTEVEEIQDFSVGIMPLPKSEWTRGKCALKALQYMACGVPCVATPHGAALDIIRHDENGLLADSHAEWRRALERLREPALRRRLGCAGRATVEERYSLNRAAPRLLELLESVV